MTPSDSGSRRRDHLQVVDDRPLWARLTGRAVVLILVAAALVMSLAFPIREYLAQRAAIAAAEERAATLDAQVGNLQEQADRWDDDDFVEQQARERLHYVMPGETGLVLLSPEDMEEARKPQIAAPVEPDVAWFDTLWGSVQEADSR
ncbi:MAG: septum formation initiator family protein [Actinomycetia bacterium]|nr:septum formation initiator family protein [Actinomycetes bacterium]